MRFQLAIMANDRPEYFGRVLESWTKVRGFANWNPYVSLEPTGRLADMQGLAAAHGIPVRVNPARFGVLHHPWQIFERSFDGRDEPYGADFVVIAEDDVLVCDDILEYYTWAAKRFADEHVLAVSSASFHQTTEPRDEKRAVLHNWFTPMCWGTWDDRWHNVMRDTWDHNYSSGTPEAPQSGWDHNLNLRVIPRDGWEVVSPVASRTDHIGVVGTHMSPIDFPSSRSATYVPSRPQGEFHL